MKSYRGTNFLLLVALFVTGYAIADDFHYNNVLIGNRAAGLAGAYTAISDDATGLFYNPAGIVFSDTLQLSASANAVHTSTSTYRNVLNGGDWNRKTSTIVPNFFGLTSKLGNGYFGFSYAVTDFEVEDQDTRLTNIPGIPLFIININNNEKVTKFGPSYAMQLNDQWNFGITLYIHEREKDLVNSQFIRLADNSFEASNSYFETSESGIEPILGIIWTPQDSLSVGLSVRKTYVTSSKSRAQSFCASDVNNLVLQSTQCIQVNNSPIDPTVASSSEKRDLPLNIRFGVAYFPTQDLLISADLSHHEAVKSAIYNVEQVVNLSIGVEYYLNAEWALRSGLYTNQSNTPEIDPAKINQADHVDLNGVSLSVTRFSKTSSLTIGYTQSSGKGQAQVIAGSSQIQTLDQSVETIYLSTSYSF
jgi:long-subunit fatty acid transport protein